MQTVGLDVIEHFVAAVHDLIEYGIIVDRPCLNAVPAVNVLDRVFRISDFGGTDGENAAGRQTCRAARHIVLFQKDHTGTLIIRLHGSHHTGYARADDDNIRLRILIFRAGNGS